MTDSNGPQPKIGEIYLMTFDGCGSEQQGLRPGLVFQNNLGNQYSPNIIALPITSASKKLSQPTHVVLPAKETGLKLDSVVLCENPQRISKERMGRFITRLPDEYMKKIAGASLMATAYIAFLDEASLLEIWRNALRLNLCAEG